MENGKRFLAVWVFGCLVGPIYGQSASSIESDSAVNTAVQFYSRTVMNQSLLYNGNDYLEIPEPYDDFPFFGSEYWEEGSVVYYGLAYDDVTMKYDVVRDELVIEHYGQDGYAAQVQLHKEKVGGFSLLGHDFIHVQDEGQEMDLRPGFYDQLVAGDVGQLLCKRRKTIQEDVSQGILEVSFSTKDSYYLIHQGKAYPVKNKKSVAKIFPEQKRKINQFARERALNFRFQREQALVELLNHIESLDQNTTSNQLQR